MWLKNKVCPECGGSVRIINVFENLYQCGKCEDVWHADELKKVGE